MRPCLHQGCPEIVEGTYCEAHQPDRERRKLPQQFVDYGSGWRKIRQRHVSKQPLCASCERAGRTTPAQEVDHIVPWRGDVRLLRAGWNLQSLCRSCHHEKTRADEGWVELLYPAPGKRTTPVTVICGPPAVGKSTYAEQLEVQQVLDFDAIYRELGATPRMVTVEIVRAALELRNQRLARDVSTAVVAMLPRAHERRWWAEIYGATVVRLDAPGPALLRRIDARRPARREQSLAAMKRWREQYEPDAEDSPVIVRDCGQG